MGAACSLGKSRSPRRRKNGAALTPRGGPKQQYELSFGNQNDDDAASSTSIPRGDVSAAGSSQQSASNPARPRGGGKSINPNQRLCEVPPTPEKDIFTAPQSRRPSFQPPPYARHDSDADYVYDSKHGEQCGGANDGSGGRNIGEGSPIIALQIRPLQSHASDMSTVLPLIRQETAMYAGGGGLAQSSHRNPSMASPLLVQKPFSSFNLTNSSFHSGTNLGSSPRGEHSSQPTGFVVPTSGTRSSYILSGNQVVHAHQHQHGHGQGQSLENFLGIGLGSLPQGGGVLNSARQHSTSAPADTSGGSSDAHHFVMSSVADKHLLTEGSTLLASSHNSSYNATVGAQPLPSQIQQNVGGSKHHLGLLCESGAPNPQTNIRVTNTNTNVTTLKRGGGGGTTSAGEAGGAYVITLHNQVAACNSAGNGGFTNTSLATTQQLSSSCDGQHGTPLKVGFAPGGGYIANRRYSSIAEFESNFDKSLDRSNSNLCSTTLAIGVSAAHVPFGSGTHVGVGGGPLNESVGSDNSLLRGQQRGGGGGVRRGASDVGRGDYGSVMETDYSSSSTMNTADGGGSSNNLVRNFNSVLLSHRFAAAPFAEANSDDEGGGGGDKQSSIAPKTRAKMAKQRNANTNLDPSVAGTSGRDSALHLEEEEGDDSALAIMQPRLPSLPGLFDSQRGRPQGLVQHGGHNDGVHGSGVATRRATRNSSAKGLLAGGGVGNTPTNQKGVGLSSSLFGENMQSLMETSLVRGEEGKQGPPANGVPQAPRRYFHSGPPSSCAFLSALPSPTNADTKGAAAQHQQVLQRQKIVNIHIPEDTEDSGGSRRESGQSGSNTSGGAASPPTGHRTVSFLNGVLGDIAQLQVGRAACIYSGPMPTAASLPGVAMDASTFTIHTAGPSSLDKRTAEDVEDEDENAPSSSVGCEDGRTRSGSDNNLTSSAGKKATAFSVHASASD